MNKKHFYFQNKIPNKYLVFLTMVILLLINEFTLSFFDKNPPLANNTIWNIRKFNLFCIFFLLFLNFWIKIIYFSLRKIAGRFEYILIVFFVLVISDIIFRLLGFGYQLNIDESYIYRQPSPYDSFVGRPLVKDHNEFGFRGKFTKLEDINENSISIGFFGGSSGYNGNPPIIELVSQNLENLNYKIEFYNFSSVSSAHSQHIHRLLKFYDLYKFDFIIFYGGFNEALLHLNYDRRPGYPFNFFYKRELNPFLQSVLKYSSIIGTIDIFTGRISGMAGQKINYQGVEWEKKIIKKYLRDLNTAKNITEKLIEPNYCKIATFVPILQPVKPLTKEDHSIWKLLTKSNELQKIENLQNLSLYENKVNFLDEVHTDQNSKQLVANKISHQILQLIRLCR